MEGSEKKQEKLALSFAHSKLQGGGASGGLAVFLLQLQMEIILAHINECFYRGAIQVSPSPGAVVLWEFILAAML